MGGSMDGGNGPFGRALSGDADRISLYALALNQASIRAFHQDDISLANTILTFCRLGRSFYPDICSYDRQEGRGPGGSHLLLNVGPMIAYRLFEWAKKTRRLPINVTMAPMFRLKREESHGAFLGAPADAIQSLRDAVSWHLSRRDLQKIAWPQMRRKDLDPLCFIGADPRDGNPLVIALDRMTAQPMTSNPAAAGVDYCAKDVLLSIANSVESDASNIIATPVWRPVYLSRAHFPQHHLLDQIHRAMIAHGLDMSRILTMRMIGSMAHIQVSAAGGYASFSVEEVGNDEYVVHRAALPRTIKDAPSYGRAVRMNGRGLADVIMAQGRPRRIRQDDRWFQLRCGSAEVGLMYGPIDQVTDVACALGSFFDNRTRVVLEPTAQDIPRHQSIRVFRVADMPGEPIDAARAIMNATGMIN